MKVKVKSNPTIVIELTEDEARWLKRFTQNAFEDEEREELVIREGLFNLLDSNL